MGVVIDYSYNSAKIKKIKKGKKEGPLKGMFMNFAKDIRQIHAGAITWFELHSFHVIKIKIQQTRARGFSFYASQPLKMVARATRLTPSVKAPMRRLQLCVWHIFLMLWKALVMYFLSSLFTLSSSHMKPCMFYKQTQNLI